MSDLQYQPNTSLLPQQALDSDQRRSDSDPANVDPLASTTNPVERETQRETELRDTHNQMTHDDETEAHIHQLANEDNNSALTHNYNLKRVNSTESHHDSIETMDKMAYTDDGLDQEIQRAIAQHDLQQQQLQQKESAGSVNSNNNQDKDLNSIHDEHYAQDGDHLDPDEEKRHLQMIADELKRATSSDKSTELHDTNTMDNGNDIRQFDGTQDFGGLPASGQSQQGGFESSSARARTYTPTQSQDESSGTQQSHAAHIPPDSELLATNTALAAYNALSSHVPPVALLASVHLAALPLPIIAPDYLPARIQLLIGTLPVLDNLSTQLLRYFAVGPYQKIIDLASNPDTAQGAAFRDLASLFEVTKRLYSEEDPFITVEHLAPGMWKEGDTTLSVFRSREQSIESTLRKVNLATFLAATLGLLEAGFFHLNEAFLSVFCPLNNLDPANSMSNMSPTNMNPQSNVNSVIGDKVGKIFKPQASLYLDLKTQAFISGLVAGERSREAILEDVFPTDLEEILLKRRGVKTLSPTELDFVTRCKSRKETLLKSESDNFSEQYEWFAFLKDLFDLVCKDMSILIWGKKTKTLSSRPDRSLPASRIPSHFDSSLTPHSDETLQNLGRNNSHASSGSGESSGGAIAPNSLGAPDVTNSQEIKDITAGLLPSEIQEQQIHLRINPGITGRVPNRRPWTREEEKALRYALELKGPHWSTILELFGQGGQINESLKNRTQVQLKDKARNWKMFFLKSRLPVPEYLKRVTGDLDRDDKLRAKTARSKKTAAAPVPAVTKRDGDLDPELETSAEKRLKM